jgi:catechol 2,3-dioxygenase-like lactoylglutathione lyase family enzyme
MPARGIHHVDLAVLDLAGSIAFYLAILGPVGMREEGRWLSYRGTEEVVYLRFGPQLLGLRAADGGEHRYGIGIELAFYVDTRQPPEAEGSGAT